VTTVSPLVGQDHIFRSICRSRSCSRRSSQGQDLGQDHDIASGRRFLLMYKSLCSLFIERVNFDYKALSTVSQKSETVAEKCDCRRKRRENGDTTSGCISVLPNSAVKFLT